MNGCGNLVYMSDAGGKGDPTETLGWIGSHSPQTCRQQCIPNLALTWNPEGKQETWRRDLDLTRKKLDADGDMERLDRIA